MSGNRIPPGLLAAAFGVAVVAVLLYTYRHLPAPEPVAIVAPETVEPAPAEPAEAPPAAEDHPEKPEPPVSPAPPQDPAEALAADGSGTVFADPAELVRNIGAALEAGDFSAAGRLFGGGALTPENRQVLVDLAKAGLLKPAHPDTVREVGEAVLDERSRWALRLEGDEPGGERLRFDLRKQYGGWSVETVILPPGAADSLSVADAFLQAALRQHPQRAKTFTNPAKVSEAKVARLCALFGSGGYHLRLHRPLLPALKQGGTAGYLARVEKSGAAAPGEISLVLEKDGSGWRVSDLNLDASLSR